MIFPRAVRWWTRACIVAACTVPVAALSGQETGTIAGRVTLASDSTRPAGPAVGAAVTAGNAAGSTDRDGRFVLSRVPSGRASVRVRLFGYRETTRVVDVSPGDTTRLELVLLPQARLLDPVRADARSPDAVAFESRPSIGTVAITARAMEGVPKVGEADVVRVAQLLPGVIARNDFTTGLNVRGGEADQNLILIDGFPIYNPFHLGGLFSTFMDATVGGIELLSAAYPAPYGGRLSSVLDVHSAEERRAGVNTTLDVSALGASARLGGAIGERGGMWSVAARRTYADAATAAFTSSVFPYHFRDLHARGVYAFSNALRLALTAYQGADALDLDLARYTNDSLSGQARDGAWTFGWGNDVVGLSLSKDIAFPRLPLVGWSLGESATFEQRVSTSAFSTLLDVGNGSQQDRSAIRDVRAAGSFTARGAAHAGTVGYEVTRYAVRYASGAIKTGTTDVELRQRPVSAALWIGDLWRAGERWLLEGGLRAEALSSRSWFALSPRLSVKFFATPDLALTAGAGRVTQWLHSLAGDGPLRYFDIWLASDAFIPVATASHYVAGAERRFGDRGTVRIEGYAKRYDRALDVNPSDDPRRRGDEFFTGDGLSYGVDLLARLNPRDRRLSGWLAYSYGLSWRERDGMRWAPGHDRRHDIDLVATWRTAQYRFGARLGFATGTPYTPIVGEIARRVYDPSLDRWGTGDPRVFVESLGAGRNSARFPATHRIDLDASREFHVRGAVVAPYLSVMNAYNARNVFVYLYNYSTDAPTRRAISQFPILPSAGVRVAF